jgi:murein L,D-transpeptidase YcbB/YkuD
MSKLIFILLAFLVTTATQASEPLREAIRNYIENKPEHTRYRVDDENLFSSQVLPRFYINRVFRAAWSDNKTLSTNAVNLIEYIQTSDKHGLQPGDYHLRLIESYAQKIQGNANPATLDMMKMDLLLTDAFLLLAAHLYFGKVNPEKIGADWKIQRKEPELMLDDKLEDALKAGNIFNYLDMLAPSQHSYPVFKEQLAYYRSIAQDEWNTIQITASIKPGESSANIPLVRKRLKQLRYKIADETSIVYDSLLVLQVQRFQRHHGLNPDGVIGRMTAEALNVHPAKRAETIRVNLERMRWMPLDVPERYILINIANYELDVFEKQDTVLTMRAIVGRHYRKTPVFNSMMTYLVLSPTWTIPPTIFRNDVLPELRKGPEYLSRKNMKILRFDGTEVDYHSIDWETVTAANFPFMVRQSPGADNALGRVKFMYPNTYNVYIHDTPGRELFAKEDRSFSSGCIRIEKPFELTKYLLSDNPAWTEERIRTAMNADREQTVRLQQHIPVYMTYFTAWVSGTGGIHFRKDVYDRDGAVLRALREKPGHT